MPEGWLTPIDDRFPAPLCTSSHSLYTDVYQCKRLPDCSVSEPNQVRKPEDSKQQGGDESPKSPYASPRSRRNAECLSTGVQDYSESLPNKVHRPEDSKRQGGDGFPKSLCTWLHSPLIVCFFYISLPD